MTNPYYLSYMAALAQRDADALVLLGICAGITGVYFLARALGRPVYLVTVGILALAYFTLFVQGIMEVLK